jgi:uncharacterized circularly permuted ATP-grasp superfamily protein/uncharacterized alpha-E superfamily protein
VPDNLLQSYGSTDDRYDELLSGEKDIRPHWRELITSLDKSGAGPLRDHQEYARRCILDNGVTYNVYGDPKGADRPWSLDVLPLILPADEWAGIESALIQRAKLLDQVLADLYGPQTLLKEGLIPPALIYGHDGFLWPCQGVKPPDGRFLHTYAADLARSPDGKWWVIADRTQAPSGLGYALENRLIVSRLFPDLFSDLQVEHLAQFFRAMFDNLVASAPVEPGETPSIVLLTPGAYNETYFEHAYLARYLGLPLIEGQDLTVRGDTVYLKTLSGLKRVHGIMRRLDDDYCDPLEFRANSALGVPGLLQAIRAGRVLVANALGSGVLQSPGLLAFLPAIAKHMTGENLQMSAVATWWCGEAPARKFVLDHMDELVIKPAYPSQRMSAVFCRDLDEAGRAEWAMRIARRPEAYVAQELVALSQAPVASEGSEPQIAARSIGLRVYAVATADGYRVMPGGLTRVAGAANAQIISMQHGGLSKDTWVLADGPVNRTSLLKRRLTAHDIVRADPNLASRTAENFVWRGRYTERVEYSARLIREALVDMLDGGADKSAGAVRILALLAQYGFLPPEEDKRRSLQRRLIQGIVGDGNGQSLAMAIRRAVWSASNIRERLSVDHMQSLNRLQESISRPNSQRLRLDQSLALLDGCLMECMSLSGFAWDDMMRDAAWRLHVAGRRIERLQFMAASVRSWLLADDPSSGLEALLALADSADSYRYRYQRAAELIPVIDLVVCDPDNPRSVAFQAANLVRTLQPLIGQSGFELPGAFHRARLALDRFDLALFEPGAKVDLLDNIEPAPALANTLDKLSEGARLASDALTAHFFAHVGNATLNAIAS